MKTYCIPVTYECNWDCPYCIEDTHNKHTTYEKALDFIRKIEPGSKVSLSGGEPGLLSSEQLMEIIGVLTEKGCSIELVTNGMVFNHPEVVDIVDSIYYHCTINMDIDDVVIRDYADKTTYVVVVTDENIDNLDNFLSKNNDIQFMIYPAKSGRGVSLSKKNVLKIFSKYKDVLNEDNKNLLLNFNEVIKRNLR